MADQGTGKLGTFLTAPARQRLMSVVEDEEATPAPAESAPEAAPEPVSDVAELAAVADEAGVADASTAAPAEPSRSKRGSGTGTGRRKSTSTSTSSNGATAPRTASSQETGPSARPASKNKGGRVTLRVSQDLRDLLWKASKQRDCSLAEVVFDAVEAAAASQRLGEIVAEHMPETVVPATGPNTLFSRPVSRRAQAKVTVELRMTSADRKTLDLLVKQHKAESRSQLIIAALQDHLAPTGAKS